MSIDRRESAFLLGEYADEVIAPELMPLFRSYR